MGKLLSLLWLKRLRHIKSTQTDLAYHKNIFAIIVYILSLCLKINRFVPNFYFYYRAEVSEARYTLRRSAWNVTKCTTGKDNALLQKIANTSRAEIYTAAIFENQLNIFDQRLRSLTHAYIVIVHILVDCWLAKIGFESHLARRLT